MMLKAALQALVVSWAAVGWGQPLGANPDFVATERLSALLKHQPVVKIGGKQYDARRSFGEARAIMNHGGPLVLRAYALRALELDRGDSEWTRGYFGVLLGSELPGSTLTVARVDTLFNRVIAAEEDRKTKEAARVAREKQRQSRRELQAIAAAMKARVWEAEIELMATLTRQPSPNQGALNPENNSAAPQEQRPDLNPLDFK